jgi:tetratricopeptide (TPR) repeat protein
VLEARTGWQFSAPIDGSRGDRAGLLRDFGSAKMPGMTRAFLLLLLILLAGCHKPAPRAPQLVLVPMGDSAEARGALGLIAARLRAIRGVELSIDARGCGRPQATHTLRVSRQRTAHSLLSAAELKDCASEEVWTETIVYPLQAASDPSQALAFWVAQQVGKRGVLGATLDANEPALRKYYTALGHLEQRDRGAIERARDLLRALTDSAPNFPAAHAELAIAELLASEYGIQSSAAALERAQTSIARALALDPDLGLAHAAQGLHEMVAGRYQSAIAPLRVAHAADPGHDAILLWLGNAHLYSGAPKTARRWLESAQAANPNLGAIAISLGEADCYAGVETRCAEFLARAATQPMQAYVQLLIRAHRGDFAAVRDALKNASPQVAPSWTTGLLGATCRALADPSCAAPLIAENATAFAEPDLWQLDLGWAEGLAQNPTEAAREAARAELARWSVEVRLPVLKSIGECLAQLPVADPAHARLLGCTAIGDARAGR